MQEWLGHVPKRNMTDDVYRRRFGRQRELEDRVRRIMVSSLVLFLLATSVVFGWYLYDWVH